MIMQNLTCKAMMLQGATTGSEGVILNDKNPDEYNDAIPPVNKQAKIHPKTNP